MPLSAIKLLPPVSSSIVQYGVGTIVSITPRSEMPRFKIHTEKYLKGDDANGYLLCFFYGLLKSGLLWFHLLLRPNWSALL